MGVEALLALTQKTLAKTMKDNTIEIQMASSMPPLDGLMVDNPLFEFILDRVFFTYSRFVLMYGKKSSSKTSFFFELVKLFQRNGGEAIWVETERADDRDYVAKQGVDIHRLGIIQPQSFEEGLESLSHLIANNRIEDPDGKVPKLICFDSIPGVGVEAEVDDKYSMEQVQMAKQARLLSIFYRRNVAKLAHQKMIVVFINQLKEKITDGRQTFSEDSHDALLGGNSQFFYSTYQFKLTRISDITTKDVKAEAGEEAEAAVRKVGSIHQLECKRNKVGREGKGQVIKFPLYRNGGIDWDTPLVMKLRDEYPDIVKMKTGGHHLWVPGALHYRKMDGTEGILQPNEMVSKVQLANIIHNSQEAKDIIRKAFGIPAKNEAGVVEEIPMDAHPDDTEPPNPETTKKQRGRPPKTINIV